MLYPTKAQDKTKVTFWEVIFIVFASAFTLEEYTASTGHGWISQFNLLLVLVSFTDFPSYSQVYFANVRSKDPIAKFLQCLMTV